MAMRTFDMSPLFRNSVGFDRMARLMDSVAADSVPTYPPYNIEVTGEDTYRITMAVAGFGEGDLDIQVKENQLTVAGKLTKSDTEGEETRYLHRGIAERAFERRFNLADHIQVAGARLVNGLLHVELKREVPEAMKPRTIAINGNKVQEIADKAA
jgi:molecular chaperone IbpA